MPASKKRFLSLSKASADTAIIGTCLASLRLSSLIFLVASIPSITGIRLSISITAYSLSFEFSNFSKDFVTGKNACFIPETKQVVVNTDKISIAGFHELGHAMNNLMSKYGVKYLAKLRAPGYAIAGLMEYFAIFSRTKPKGAPRSFTDFIEDNCGKIAFLTMLPVVAEEAVASYRGVKLAKKAGLPDTMIKSMKTLYEKALLTYGGRAVLGGLAVYTSRKIMDAFTRPKQIKQSESFSSIFS